MLVFNSKMLISAPEKRWHLPVLCIICFMMQKHWCEGLESAVSGGNIVSSSGNIDSINISSSNNGNIGSGVSVMGGISTGSSGRNGENIDIGGSESSGNIVNSSGNIGSVDDRSSENGNIESGIGIISSNDSNSIGNSDSKSENIDIGNSGNIDSTEIGSNNMGSSSGSIDTGSRRSNMEGIKSSNMTSSTSYKGRDIRSSNINIGSSDSIGSINIGSNIGGIKSNNMTSDTSKKGRIGNGSSNMDSTDNPSSNIRSSTTASNNTGGNIGSSIFNNSDNMDSNDSINVGVSDNLETSSNTGRSTRNSRSSYSNIESSSTNGGSINIVISDSFESSASSSTTGSSTRNSRSSNNNIESTNSSSANMASTNDSNIGSMASTSSDDEPCQYDEDGSTSGANCPKFTDVLGIEEDVDEDRRHVLTWGLRDQSWVIPLMALAVFNLTIIAFFELFVLVKTLYSRPSRRHLFLGQMLLLGLFMSSLLGFAFVTRPNAVTCTLSRLGVGLAYALVLATLVVKSVFLISLNGGVYLPATYLGLLLFFAVAVQLVEGVQWLVLVSPAVVAEDDTDWTVVGASRCSTGFTELLLSLVYVMFLLFFAGVLAIKSSGIRENYREATYIAVAVGALTVVWLTWMVTGLVMGREYEDACVAFGLVGGSSVCFLVMFLPKGRQLAALGQEGLYLEDRDDVLSDATTPPSAYAPSFYHFTPVYVPPWDAPHNVLYKNAVPERKCHKFSSVPGRGRGCRPNQKLGETGHVIAGRHVNVGAPNLHSSMMY